MDRRLLKGSSRTRTLQHQESRIEDSTLLTDLHRILMQLAVISGWLGLAFRGVCLISVDRSRGPWGIPTPSRLRPASTPQTVPESDGAAICTAPSPGSETCGWFAPHGCWSGLAG